MHVVKVTSNTSIVKSCQGNCHGYCYFRAVSTTDMETVSTLFLLYFREKEVQLAVECVNYYMHDTIVKPCLRFWFMITILGSWENFDLNQANCHTE